MPRRAARAISRASIAPTLPGRLTRWRSWWRTSRPARRRKSWHPAPDDRLFNEHQHDSVGGDTRRLLDHATAGRRRIAALLLAEHLGRRAPPVLLTTTDGIIEDATAWALSKDGKTFYYCTNAGDIDRRHIWAVPTAGGTPAADHDRRRHRERAGRRSRRQADRGAQRRREAAAVRRHLAVAATPATRAAAQKVIYPTLGPDFPIGGDGRADQRHAQGGGRRRVPQPAVPAEGHQAGREAAGADLRARRAGSGRCCSASTT